VADFSCIDKNFKIDTKINKNDIKFYDIKNAPFSIHGVFYENGKFRRIPESIAKKVSSGVCVLHTNTAGGRVRFKTDSSYVAIHTKMSSVGKMPHFALTGSAGFDLYVDNNYIKTFVPPFDIVDGYESLIELGTNELKEITINFPLYSSVDELYIGISDSSALCEAAPYKHQKPMVYYGSSITQGGCASRPGNSYESIISRRFNADYINLGFSGNAKAEEEIAKHISGMDMSVFVYDYDHNAPTNEHLQLTHERMYKTVRAANPDLPVIIMSRPKPYLNDTEKHRLEIIRATYESAKQNGEKVYLLDGPTLMKAAGNDGTVDGCHPNDLGFASMAKAVGDVLETIL